MSDPLSIFQYQFFQHALAAAILTSVIAAMVGTYIVSRRIVFIGGGITHASFGGIGLAYYMGLNPFMGAAVFGVMTALGIEWVSQKGKVREDSAIAILWSLGMAVGIIFVFITPGYTPNLMSFLFGNILTVSMADIRVLLVYAILLILLFGILYRPILYTAFDPEFARTKGIPVAGYRYMMSVVMALSIVLSIRTVGIILVLSMFTIPQITAMLFTRNFSRIMPLAALWGIVGSVAGIMGAYLLDIPTSAAIIFFLTIQFLIIKMIIIIRNAIIRKPPSKIDNRTG